MDIEFSQDCQWMIGKNNCVFGIGDVEGMMFSTKNQLYDCLASSIGFDASILGIKFYDFRKNKKTKHAKSSTTNKNKKIK